MRRWLASDLVLAAVLAVFAALIAAMAVVVLLAFVHSDEAIQGIQRSRLELCEQQNERHDDTLRALDEQIAKLPPKARARAVGRRAGTVALIDALSPRRDCAAAIHPGP